MSNPVTDQEPEAPAALIRRVLTQEMDFAAECGVDPDRVELLLERVDLLPDRVASLCEGWAAEFKQAIDDLLKLRKAVGLEQWKKMPALKAMGLREGKKRERLEDRLRRLLHQELPGPLVID